MGLLSWLGIGPSVAPSSLTSPWQPKPTNLSQLTVREIWGEDIAASLPLDRSVAISVPAVSRARNLLVGAIQQYPLVALNRAGVLDSQPYWLYRTDDAVSPMERTAWTVDDLIFYGCSLWLVTRGAAGQILTATWHPFKDWRIGDGVIETREPGSVEWFEREPDDYLLINSPFEGLLNIAARTIRGAISTEEAWVGRMRNPIPLIELHVTDDTELEEGEIEDQVTTWAKSRTGPDGAVSWTPSAVDLRTHGEVKADLFTEGRNAIRTDIGNFMNIPTSMMDGSLAEASLTYQTTEGVRNRFQAESIPFWTAPIEAALSADNAVPAGTRVRFDRSADYTPIPYPTGIPTED